VAHQNNIFLLIKCEMNPFQIPYTYMIFPNCLRYRSKMRIAKGQDKVNNANARDDKLGLC